MDSREWSLEVLERFEGVQKETQTLIFDRSEAREFLYEELAMAKHCEYLCSIIKAKITPEGRSKEIRDNSTLIQLDNNSEYQELYLEGLEHRRNVNEANKNIQMYDDSIRIKQSELTLLSNMAQVN